MSSNLKQLGTIYSIQLKWKAIKYSEIKQVLFKGSLWIYSHSYEHEIIFSQYDSQLDQVFFLFQYRMRTTFQGAREDIY